MVNNDNPPSYEYVTSQSSRPNTPPLKAAASVTQSSNGDDGPYQDDIPTMQAGASYTPGAGPIMHHYINPNTGERIMTPLPPSHPEMICLQEGRHIKHTKFGLLGILAAIFWFPLGVGLCLLDRRVTCDRCGRTIEDGILCG
ncbi:hypothetical protein M422DRAFT_25284 [Sphaerobolus stellatus SS14]|nr:hypothetical protein M422DRAFT_25284 [Sphaerobolus stellatus SS14]